MDLLARAVPRPNADEAPLLKALRLHEEQILKSLPKQKDRISLRATCTAADTLLAPLVPVSLGVMVDVAAGIAEAQMCPSRASPGTCKVVALLIRAGDGAARAVAAQDEQQKQQRRRAGAALFSALEAALMKLATRAGVPIGEAGAAAALLPGDDVLTMRLHLVIKQPAGGAASDCASTGGTAATPPVAVETEAAAAPVAAGAMEDAAVVTGAPDAAARAAQVVAAAAAASCTSLLLPNALDLAPLLTAISPRVDVLRATCAAPSEAALRLLVQLYDRAAATETYGSFAGHMLRGMPQLRELRLTRSAAAALLGTMGCKDPDRTVVPSLSSVVIDFGDVGAAAAPAAAVPAKSGFNTTNLGSIGAVWLPIRAFMILSKLMGSVFPTGAGAKRSMQFRAGDLTCESLMALVSQLETHFCNLQHMRRCLNGSDPQLYVQRVLLGPGSVLLPTEGESQSLLRRRPQEFCVTDWGGEEEEHISVPLQIARSPQGSRCAAILRLAAEMAGPPLGLTLTLTSSFLQRQQQKQKRQGRCVEYGDTIAAVTSSFLQQLSPFLRATLRSFKLRLPPHPSEPSNPGAGAAATTAATAAGSSDSATPPATTAAAPSVAAAATGGGPRCRLGTNAGGATATGPAALQAELLAVIRERLPSVRITSVVVGDHGAGPSESPAGVGGV